MTISEAEYDEYRETIAHCFNLHDQKKIHRDKLISEGNRTLTERDKLQDAMVQDMSSILPSLFFTLTMEQSILVQTEGGCTSRRYLDLQTAACTMDVFCQMLSRELYGRKCIKHRELIEARGYFEGDPLSSISGREHLHFHGLMGNLPEPFDLQLNQEHLYDLETIIQPLWTKLDWGADQISLDKIEALTATGCLRTTRTARYSTKKINPDEPDRYYAFGNFVHLNPSE